MVFFAEGHPRHPAPENGDSRPPARVFLAIFPQNLGGNPVTDLPRYRAVEPCFLQPVGYAVPIRVEIGQEIEFMGVPGLALMPLNAAARAAKASSIRTAVIDGGAQHMHQRVRLARSLGFNGVNSLAARKHVEDFLNNARAE